MRSLRRFILLFIVLMLAVVSGCGQKQKRDDEVVGYFKNIDSYQCKADIKIINDRQTNECECNLYYSKKKGSRVEIGKDRVLLYQDNKEYVKDNINNRTYEQSEDFDKVYKMSLINQYIKLIYINEETKYYIKQEKDKEYQLIELYIPENNRNMTKAVLYVDTKTLVPDKILVYDNKDKERIQIKYRDFVANEKVDDKLFTLN